MADQMSGWARLGDALGGDSELEYEKGLNLGANTENALSQASERRSKAKAQSQSEESFVALGLPRSKAHAMSVAQQAGGSFKDVGDILLKDQELGFRNDAAGVTGLDQATGNRRAMGFASGPVDRYQIEGGVIDDRFDEAGAVKSPGAGTSGGSAAAIQVLTAFGLIGPDGRVAPQDLERAFDVMRTTQSNVQVGEQPSTVTANPYHNNGKPPTAVPAAPIATVAGNKGEVARQVEIGKGAGEAANALPDQLADISKLRDSVNGLLSSKGFDGVYGNIQGQPVIRTAMALLDQDVQDSQIRLKNIDAQTFAVAVQKMRGLGQLSNAEGTKVTDAYTRAVDPRTSAEEARLAWNEVLDGLDLAEARAKRKAQVSTLPGDQQPPAAPPPAAGQPRAFTTIEEAEDAGLPDGTPITVGGRKATWRN